MVVLSFFMRILLNQYCAVFVQHLFGIQTVGIEV